MLFSGSLMQQLFPAVVVTPGLVAVKGQIASFRWVKAELTALIDL